MRRGAPLRSNGASRPLRYSTISFDATGTLFKVKGSVGDTYCRVATKHGLKGDWLSPPVFDATFRQAWKQQSALSNKSSEPMSVDWWKSYAELATVTDVAPHSTALISSLLKTYAELRVVQTTFSSAAAKAQKESELAKQTPAEFDAMFSTIWEMFNSGENWQLYPETVDVLKKLREQGYKLGLASNFDTRIYKILSSLDLLDRFDWIATSAELGKEKPDKEFFSRLIALSGVPASEIVHVGDHIVNDYQGATAAGIDAIYLARDQTEIPRGMRSIRSLTELLDLEKRCAPLY